MKTIMAESKAAEAATRGPGRLLGGAARGSSRAGGGVRGFIEALGRSARTAGPSTTTLIARLGLPAELAAVRAEELLSFAPAEDAFLISPRGGARIAGLETAVSLEASGPERFERLTEAAGEALASITRVVTGGVRAPRGRPRFVGGLSFEPELGDAALADARDPTRGSSRIDGGLGTWAGFGAASFVLPRWQLETTRGHAELQLVVPRSELTSRGGERRLEGEVEALLEHLARRSRLAASSPAGAGLPAGHAAELRGFAPPLSGWSDRVRRCTRAIERGDLEKVVLARQATVQLPRIPEERHLLARLDAASGAARLVFLFRKRGATFLGASPELLVEKQGQLARTEALAGTTSGGDRAPPHVAGDAKLDEEHQLVVRAVVEALRPHAREVHVAPRGHLDLGHLTHLRTEISARVAEDAHVLDLAASLHPTPAVAGSPRSAALLALESTEAPRGWYAGPIGWFDAEGDGALFVALRCALTSGTGATLFTGAGIVRGSDALTEWNELELKERVMREVFEVRS